MWLIGGWLVGWSFVRLVDWLCDGVSDAFVCYDSLRVG